ncbi:MAG: DNA-directed RNA polymerase subunit D [Candidatus Aenigmatarchaeota archaeon]
MEVNILERNDREVKFLVSGIKSSFAGALRRIMIAEVPTMAIEWVEFNKNGSAMPDEVLTSRMGQVPLTYDPKAYNLKKDCKCEGKGCSRCEVKLVVKKKGPSMVYSDDLKTTDKSVVPFIDKIPIVELFDDQELELIATAQLGLGREHSKWQGAVVGYKNLPNIKIGDVAKDDVEKFVKVCPRKVFKEKDGKLVVTDPIKCILCMSCVEDGKKGDVNVTPVEDAFVFSVETTSGIKAEDVVMMATDALGAKMKDFQKELGKLK